MRDMSSVDKRSDPHRYRLHLTYILLAACVKEMRGGDNSPEVQSYLNSVKTLYHGPVEDPDAELEAASKALKRIVHDRIALAPVDCSTSNGDTENQLVHSSIFTKGRSIFVSIWSFFLKRSELITRNVAVALQDSFITGTVFVWALVALIFVLLVFVLSFFFIYKLSTSENVHVQQDVDAVDEF